MEAILWPMQANASSNIEVPVLDDMLSVLEVGVNTP